MRIGKVKFYNADKSKKKGMPKYLWRKKRILGEMCLYVYGIETAPTFLVF